MVWWDLCLNGIQKKSKYIKDRYKTISLQDTSASLKNCESMSIKSHGHIQYRGALIIPVIKNLQNEWLSFGFAARGPSWNRVLIENENNVHWSMAFQWENVAYVINLQA